MEIDLVSLITLVVVVFMFSGHTARLKRIESKLSWLEHRLEHGLIALDVEPEQNPMLLAVDDLMAQGKNGQAYRLYMDATGADFDEARAKVLQRAKERR